MSVFASLGIILLSMLIQGFLQTSPAIFSIFYHYASGKSSAKKADDKSLSFILGVEICTAFLFLAVYFIITFILLKFGLNSIFMYVMAGICIAEAIIIFLFYFRRGLKNQSTTKLFLPRSLAKKLLSRTESIKNRTSTILLGFVSCAIELFFTLPLFILSSVEIFELSFNGSSVFIIAYIVIATLPLFTIRTLFKRDYNLANIQRFRVKNKSFFRATISISYLLIATLIITSELNLW